MHYHVWLQINFTVSDFLSMYSSCERELEFEPVPLQCEALNVSEQQVWRLRKLIMLTVVSVGGQGIMCRGESGVYIGST